LLGGETAILPDLYQRGDYDLAGFCVGVVERRKVIDGRAIVPGDLILGIASSGLHSNGYSLVRKIVFEIAGLKVGDFVEPLGRTVGEALLEPTRVYVRAIRRVLKHYPVKSVVHGLAHITGGGLLENIERILPEGASGTVNRDSWPVPPIFRWLQGLGDVDQDEMDQVFNMGIGMALIVSPFYADSIRAQLNDLGLPTWQIGRIDAGERGMTWGK
jgi:phosphoribosylformylglycinamidine cyclo-ligase